MKETFELRSRRGDGVMHRQIRGKSILGRGNSKCKSSEVRGG